MTATTISTIGAISIAALLGAAIWLLVKWRLVDLRRSDEEMERFFTNAHALLDDPETPREIVRFIGVASMTIREGRYFRALLHAYANGEIQADAVRPSEGSKAFKAAVDALPPHLRANFGHAMGAYLTAISLRSLLLGRVSRRIFIGVLARTEGSAKTIAEDLESVVRRHRWHPPGVAEAA